MTLQTRTARWVFATACAAVLPLIPAVTSACSVCYGDPNSALTKGMQAAVFFLLGLTGLVLAGFAGMFYYFWNRARRVAVDNSVIIQHMMEASKR